MPSAGTVAGGGRARPCGGWGCHAGKASWAGREEGGGFTLRAALSLGPRRRGAGGGQRKCKQPLPVTLALEPETKDPVTKIAHPKPWPASSRLPTISLGMNEGGGVLKGAGPRRPLLSPRRPDPGVGARRKQLRVVEELFSLLPSHLA